jgi:DNA-directed RNA polymerase subunit M/transcription elongation factor TFIIS
MHRKQQYTCPQGETLKPQEDGIKKSGRTEQSGYQFKNTEPSLQAISVQHFVPQDQQEEKSIRSYPQGVEKNNKRYQENPQCTKHDKN